MDKKRKLSKYLKDSADLVQTMIIVSGLAVASVVAIGGVSAVVAETGEEAANCIAAFDPTKPKIMGNDNIVNRIEENVVYVVDDAVKSDEKSCEGDELVEFEVDNVWCEENYKTGIHSFCDTLRFTSTDGRVKYFKIKERLDLSAYEAIGARPTSFQAYGSSTGNVVSNEFYGVNFGPNVGDDVTITKLDSYEQKVLAAYYNSTKNTFLSPISAEKIPKRNGSRKYEYVTLEGKIIDHVGQAPNGEMIYDKDGNSSADKITRVDEGILSESGKIHLKIGKKIYSNTWWNDSNDSKSRSVEEALAGFTLSEIK